MCRKTGMKSYLCQVYLVPGTGYCEVLFCLPSGEVHHKLQRVGHSKIFLVDLSTRYLRNTRLPLRQPSSLVTHKHSQKKNKGETDRVCVLAATSTTCWGDESFAVACVGWARGDVQDIYIYTYNLYTSKYIYMYKYVSSYSSAQRAAFRSVRPQRPRAVFRRLLRR